MSNTFPVVYSRYYINMSNKKTADVFNDLVILLEINCLRSFRSLVQQASLTYRFTVANYSVKSSDTK